LRPPVKARCEYEIDVIYDIILDNIAEMAWKWLDIYTYKASVGGASYYGTIQMPRTGFYASITFHKTGPLPDASAPTTYGQRFYGHLDFQQMPVMLDILRNEKPLRFGWNDASLGQFHLMTGSEPIGEGDGVMAG
jgi:hypothetical protein